MFCLSEAALLDSITGCAASRLLVKATGAWPTWCLLLRLSALLPGFLHWGRARWLKPPLKPYAAAVNTGQGTARGNSQRWGRCALCEGFSVYPSGGGKDTALPLPQPCSCPSSTSPTKASALLLGQHPTLCTVAGSSYCPKCQQAVRWGHERQHCSALLFVHAQGWCHPLPQLSLGTGQLLSPYAPWSGMGATRCWRPQHPNLLVPGLCMQHLSARGSQLAARCQPLFVMC